MIQNKKNKREEEEEEVEEEERGRGKLTILLSSIRRALEVEMLHHIPKHLIILFGYWCLFFEPRFALIPTVHHYSFHRLLLHGASVHIPPLHHHHCIPVG